TRGVFPAGLSVLGLVLPIGIALFRRVLILRFFSRQIGPFFAGISLGLPGLFPIALFASLSRLLPGRDLVLVSFLLFDSDRLGILSQERLSRCLDPYSPARHTRQDDPDDDRHDGDDGKDVAGLCAERALPPQPAEGAREPAPSAALQQNDEHQE